MSKEKEKKGINIFVGFAVFGITFLLCLLFMVLCACIPQKVIRENTLESAEYFKETPLFEYCAGDFENFKRDNYADCISTGIAWHFDETRPFYAVIAADYAYAEDRNVNDTFYESVTGGKTETISYFRYWHGSAGVLRVLLCFMNIENIRCVMMVSGILLHIAVVICLFRKEQKALSVTYALAFLLVNGGFSLNCLEYGFIFLLVPMTILVLLLLGGEQKDTMAAQIFMIVGMLTAFFDFLTTETLTFTVPFAVYYIMLCEGSKKQNWFFFLRCGVNWCIGYAGMFLLKWILAAVVLGKEAFWDALDMAAERMGGDVSLSANMVGEQADLAERLMGIFTRNAGCLFWGTSDMSVRTVAITAGTVAIVLGVFWYLARKEKVQFEKSGILMVIALLPYIRFLALSNHSFIHYFFTYRAQMVTVMVVLYMIYETTFLSVKRGRIRKG